MSLVWYRSSFISSSSSPMLASFASKWRRRTLGIWRLISDDASHSSSNSPSPSSPTNYDSLPSRSLAQPPVPWPLPPILLLSLSSLNPHACTLTTHKDIEAKPERMEHCVTLTVMLHQDVLSLHWQSVRGKGMAEAGKEKGKDNWGRNWELRIGRGENKNIINVI